MVVKNMESRAQKVAESFATIFAFSPKRIYTMKFKKSTNYITLISLEMSGKWILFPYNCGTKNARSFKHLSLRIYTQKGLA